MDEKITTLCEQYRQWADTYYRRPDGTPTGQAKNIRDALRELESVHGDAAASAFNLRMLNELQDAMERSGRLCRKTVNARVKIVRAMFRWAANRGMVDDLLPNRLSAIQPLKRGRTKAKESGGVQGVSWDDVSAILPYLSVKASVMVELQWLTAMRPGEVCAMRLDEIHPSSAEVWHYCPTQHKTAHHGIDRSVSIGEVGINLIKSYLPRVTCEYLFSSTVGGKCTGRPMNPNRYREQVVMACHAAKINPWSPLQLRHSALTRTYREFTIGHAMEQAGHTTEKTTRGYIDKPAVEYTLADEVARKRG